MKNTKTIYIHLGMHKTGTTSLQYYFSGRRDFFIRQHGILYPAAKGKLNHRHRSLFPIKREEFAAIVAHAEKSHCHTIVISNESLSRAGLSDACLAAIREAAPGYSVKYILYVRRIDDLCKSWYREERRTRSLEQYPSYREFLQETCRQKANIMFPSRLLEKCIRQIGEENLIARAYAPERLKNNDIVDDFCDILGVALAAEDRPELRHNLSIPLRALPYCTPSFYSSSDSGYVQVQLMKKLRIAFERVDTGVAPAPVKVAVEKEMEKLKTMHIEGYEHLFSKKPLALDYPELKADPYHIYNAELLHAIYRRLVWPERLLWGVGAFFYHLLNKVEKLRPLLQRIIPDSQKNDKGKG